jgi:hypothetical protein
MLKARWLRINVSDMKVFETIEAWGHANITAMNATTFEITKEDHLTRKGDCIIAVNASKGARDLSAEFRRLVRRRQAKVRVMIEAGATIEMAIGQGDPRLLLNHPTDLVVRTSNYTCDRTLMIKADKGAVDFSRDLIREVQQPLRRVLITLTVEV